MSQNIAFIGLGIMGLPMAKNLINTGYNVTGYNRSDKAGNELAAAGGTKAASIAEAVADADAIITMVPDSPDVQAVVLGADGVFANAKPGALWIDNSSIRPDVAVELAATARDAG
ncbi:MAG TPA: 2-hydroxy-3-oxopropionate reductase, partial [Glutamicibacter sp.]|nr:2-hydroxy-3-oxopropionate reductase [Glutamicibacter sp.]